MEKTYPGGDSEGSGCGREATCGKKDSRLILLLFLALLCLILTVNPRIRRFVRLPGQPGQLRTRSNFRLVPLVSIPVIAIGKPLQSLKTRSKCK
jgi:hypothetical protein